MTIINYFWNKVKVILNPKLLFALRRKWSLWQIIVLGICLGVLPLISAGMRYSQLKNYSLEQIMPGSLNAITDETVKVLKEGSVKDGHFTGDSNLVQSGQSILATLPSKSNLKTIRESDYTSIVLRENEWLFYYPSGRILRADVSGTQDFKEFQSVSDVKNYINQQWFSANKKSVVSFLLIKLGAAMFSSILFFVLGGSVLMMEARKKFNFDIQNLRESLGLMVNGLVLPTILVTGLIGLGLLSRLVWIMIIFHLLVYVMIFLIYIQTGFKDEVQPLIHENKVEGEEESAW